MEEFLKEEADLIAVNALDDFLDHVRCLAMDAELKNVTSQMFFKLVSNLILSQLGYQLLRTMSATLISCHISELPSL